MSAVVVGAMSPDFEYLIFPRRTIGHTAIGVFVFCLPVSLVVLGVWHRLVWPALTPLLPGDRRAPAGRPFRFRPPRRLAAICVSVLVGAFSHILWDSFTHKGGFFESRFSVLTRPVWSGGPDGWVVAWNISSVVGTFAVTWALIRGAGLLPRRRSKPPSPRSMAADPAQRRATRREAATTVAAGVGSLAALSALRRARMRFARLAERR